jgi:chromosomal replication initiation ATPase DnaA
VSKKLFSKKRHEEVPESKLLAPDVSMVRDMVCRSYGVEEEELLASRRGRQNEARNVAIYLLTQLRGSKLKEIGTEFGISSYSTVSTIIERARNEIPGNRRLRKRIEQLRSELVLSQEQTLMTFTY